MSKKYIVALDQGTSSSRALLIDEKGKIGGIEQKEFTQIFPKPGWVEHNPLEIWESQWEVFQQLLKNNNLKATDIISIGITNQRETTVVWDKETGKPVYNAIVWQDRRTAPLCERMTKEGMTDYVRKNTGLVIDSYFSGTKINWILNHLPELRQKAADGKILFGTIDTWLIWKLTNGKAHVTDYTNASRTLIYNIKSLEWDRKMLDYLDIPMAMLPKVQASSSHFGDLELDGQRIPIQGVAGDQQAALFGQACFEPGMAKNTYGTGCFLLLNTGNEIKFSENGLLTTLCCSIDSDVSYALEGSVFIAGAAIQWLRDGLKIIKSAEDSEALARAVAGEDEVVVVPAFTGLGAPYWDMYARGAIFGLTLGTKQEHIVKATLESLAFQTRDVLDAMAEDADLKLDSLKVDGGACTNDFLMQFQADLLNVPVERPKVIETTAMGAAYLAGLGSGVWTVNDILGFREVDRIFDAEMGEERREELYGNWRKGVERTMGWKRERE
ncbi:MAG: glycerol kinase GlpK [Saprospiraceae bacterium]